MSNPNTRKQSAKAQTIPVTDLDALIADAVARGVAEGMRMAQAGHKLEMVATRQETRQKAKPKNAKSKKAKRTYQEPTPEQREATRAYLNGRTQMETALVPIVQNLQPGVPIAKHPSKSPSKAHEASLVGMLFESLGIMEPSPNDLKFAGGAVSKLVKDGVLEETVGDYGRKYVARVA